jgi:hypothetical protein
MLQALSLEVSREIRERRCETDGVILGGDPGRDVVRSDLHTSAADCRSQLPRHRHRAGVRRIVRGEVDRFDDADSGHDLDEPCVDDVRLAVVLPRPSAASAYVRMSR